MPKGVLVTGTDTGVGKTLVAAGLARALRRRGIDAGVMKPAATGVPPDEDADLLREAAGVDDAAELVSPIRLEEPLAPAVAAARAGTSVDPAAIRRAFETLASRHQFMVVEGVGGLLVPVAWGYTVADLARDLGLPLLVVARAGLGTLNHAALTIEAARRRGLRVLGVVLSPATSGPPDAAGRTNAAALERLAGVRVLGTLPRIPAARTREPDALADALEESVDLAPVIGDAGDDPRAAVERWKRLDREHVWHPFTQMQEWTDPVVIERGEGPYLFDAEGRRYIDGVSSLWVTVHGHRTPEIDAAVADQLGRVAHSTLLGLAGVPSIELAERLVRIAPPGLRRVFFSDSGSTAVEVALKMAFQHQRRRGEEKRTKFLYFEGGYHGDTLGAVSVGGIDLFHRLFRPLLFESFRAPAPHCYRCPVAKTFPSCGIDCLRPFDEVLREHGSEIAAVLVEPAMQGAAGMVTQPEGWLPRVAAAAREAGALLIADEVATGIGRTGKWFAVEHEGVRPDLLAVAKGLSGGYLPVAATLATEEIYASFLGSHEEMRTFFHGHTFTGNALACAAAVANLDLMARERTVEEAARRGEILGRLLEPLRAMPVVGDVRRRGMMAGVELVKDRATREPFPPEARAGIRACVEARKRGLLLRPLGNVVVLMPPLGTPDAVLEEIVSITAASVRAAFPEGEPMTRDWMALAGESIEMDGIARERAREALAAPPLETYEILAAARRVRTRFHGNRVRVHVLLNAKLGACPEDCGFCAQSSRYETPAGRAPLLDAAAIVRGAREAAEAGAWKFCIVTATRGPSDRDLDVLCEAVREIKRTVPVKVCTSLGLLDAPKARRLAEAGVDRFNHNLETSRRLFPEICTTHGYDDRVNTVRLAREAGMEACCGCIVGMGEGDEDLLDLAYALKDVGATSIPVNFLDPRPGTPLADRPRLTPLRCLQVLAVFRLVHPRPDLRAAGGREVNLRSLQPLALQAANSIFTDGYLTTPGNAPSDDLRMIEDAGFVIERVAEGAPYAV